MPGFPNNEARSLTASEAPSARRAALESEDVSEPEPPFFARMASAFLEEPMLWPVLAVIALTGATLLAALLVLVVQDRSLPAMAALAGVAYLGFGGVRAARGGRYFAAVGGILLSVAALGILAAAAYLRLSS